MGTKGPTGAGIQHTDRGPVQGVHLVGPSGEPIGAVLDGSGLLRLAVDADVSIVDPVIDIDIDAATGDNIAIADSTGTNFVSVNADGTISIRLLDDSGTAFSNANPLPVDIVNAIDVELDATDGDNVAISGHPTQVFDEATVGVTAGPGTFTNILTFTAASADTNILWAEITGPVEGLARLTLNGTELRRKTLNQTNPNPEFHFEEPRRIGAGDIIRIDFEPFRAIPGFMVGGADFFASLQGFVD